MDSSREQFKTRLGFILIAAGCAVGIGNVWRFPYIVGQYGGAFFVLIYLFFLIAMGIPLLTVELAIGRASRSSIAYCYENLEKRGAQWHHNKWWQLAGNYILMSFYGVITGWMLYYFFEFASGSVAPHLEKDVAVANFGSILQDPATLFSCMAAVVAFSFLIVALGVVKGIERFTKPLMLLLLGLLIFMALRSVTLDGFMDGVSFYLKPDFSKLQDNFGEAVWAAMGQAFFTLSTGMGGIAIFGSYMSTKHRLLNEALFIAGLDTSVALLSGFGAFWGALFFLFMLIAAVSTLIAVFENIIAANLELFKIDRKKAVLINFIVILGLSVLPVLGFNVLSDVHIIGSNTGITDFCDFLISNNILPIGSLVFVLFVTSKSGMKWDRYIQETNVGEGFKLTPKLFFYYRYILTTVIAVLLIIGYYTVFNRA